ncbi:MAG TPA: nodulation protein NfeD [Candidatus Limnocylindrales bacterium]|nr:nodulation protein NfeD [Candidatus Limnocylindrales bacterium]
MIASRLRSSLLRHPLRHVASLLMAVGLSAVLVGSVFGQTGSGGASVYVMPTTGIVDHVMAGYLREGLAKAEREGRSAVVIRLNTPGGSLDATRNIVETVLEAPLPTIVWVAPSGGRAASAGTFITMAGHVALMAPGTNIGAATPITGEGQDIEGALGEKVMQDTLALLRGIGELRERNVDWALLTVTEARSYTASEAVAENGVDGVAATIADVLAFADGRTVQVQGEPVTLALAGASVEELPMNPLQSFLHLLSDPNIAFILFTVGFYGIIFELQNPNFVTGILGGISIILAFIGFGSLPLNIAGLLLIALAIVLFVLEFSVTSHGLLTIAGIVCFALGAAALYTEPGTPAAPDVSVAIPVIVTMTVLTAGFMIVILFAIVRSRQMSLAGDGLIGSGLAPDTVGEVRRPLVPIGSVYAGGEEWTARSADDRPIQRGVHVKVVGRDGLTLVVEPADTSGAPAR